MPRFQKMSTPPAGCRIDNAQTTATKLFISAEAQDQPQECQGSHTVPKGTTKVGIEVTVSSEEYPSYTQKQSQYNDNWSYSFSGLSGATGRSGRVNETHLTHGSIEKKYCIDVTQQAKNGDFIFKAALSATNVKDDLLPTQIGMTIKNSCAPDLKVTSATLKTPNVRNYEVLKPIKIKSDGTGNLQTVAISLPRGSEETAWGLPLDIEYEPKEAVITKVRFGVMVNGQPLMSSDNLLSQVSGKEKGFLTFKDLKIPRINADLFAGQTQLLIELTGTLEEQEVTSKPEEGQVQFKGTKVFTPLFLTNEHVSGTRRYGSRDAGGDSWATQNTITWLKAQPFRYDDISALHVAQTSTGRSVNNH
jgi:hypothetical protein